MPAGALILRGRLRRWSAVLGLGVSLTLLGYVAAEFWRAPDRVRASLAQVAGDLRVGVEHTWWYWSALAGAVLAVAMAALAVVAVARWPEMSRRYDAPTQSRTADRAADEHALWKAISDGEDPTQ